MRRVTDDDRRRQTTATVTSLAPYTMFRRISNKTVVDSANICQTFSKTGFYWRFRAYKAIPVKDDVVAEKWASPFEFRQDLGHEKTR